MGKPVFKVVDRKGKVLIPLALRQYLGVENGDTVSLTAENGKIVVQRATVTDDNVAIQAAKPHFAQPSDCRSDSMNLSVLLENAARLIRDMELR